MLAAGVVLTIAGKLWGYEFPINKNLWTSSYVLFAGGLALLFLGFCYWTVDIKGWKTWGKPFLMMGMNPLALYAMAGLVAHLSMSLHIGGEELKGWIYDGSMYLANPYNASMLYGLTYVVAFLILGLDPISAENLPESARERRIPWRLLHFSGHCEAIRYRRAVRLGLCKRGFGPP